MDKMHRGRTDKKVKNLRPVYIIEREIREKTVLIQKAIKEGRYMYAALMGNQVSKLKEELEDVQDTIKYEEYNRNMDRSEQSFFSKILSLSLNEADLAIYHIDMFFTYMKDRGFIPVAEWERRKRILKSAVYEYRNFVGHFFKDKQNLACNHEDLIRLMDLVRSNMFTDREKVYYDKYEEKSGGEE